MTKTTDGLGFDEVQVGRLVQLVRDIITAQVDSAEEGFTVACGVFAQFTLDIKPECREQMVERMGEALRVYWKEHEDRARALVN